MRYRTVFGGVTEFTKSTSIEIIDNVPRVGVLPSQISIFKSLILLIDQTTLTYFLFVDAAMNVSVSDFIVGTCRTLPKSNTSIYNKLIHFSDSEESVNHYILCGSCAEFFIQPLQPCFGDFDYLVEMSNCLVFTDEKPFLPYVFPHIAHPMNCVLMEPYHDYPNFVRLRIFGQITYDWDLKTFKFVNAKTREF